ncbi:probable receptor-like protein kinase At5g59700 [Pyrus x bretschneideri]|uniref:probable receptor-like protein kinase At5g59700 n=1 Tax=Pyrus x bretschneideri TaxID=225117 RepID=UPI00202FFEFC|nr:probable receptor-like protein kinase At5g59700 [Pyrus x bretschneideri]
MAGGTIRLFIGVTSILFSICVSLGFNPEDSYLINCGSSSSVTVGGRVFVSDESASNLLSAPQTISANAISKSNSSSFDSVLYQSARIFDKTSLYTFPITKQGRHWIRLYFSPFVHGSYNSSTAKFSVSAQTFTLVKELRMESDSFVMEYSLNVTSETLVLTFTPASNSFAFVNALEVVSIPDKIIPEDARTIGSKENRQSLRRQALETVVRVNMGNQTVSPPNDTLRRHWVSDDLYLMHNGLPEFVSNESAVHYTSWPTEDVAPSSVYGTATKLDNTKTDALFNANLTWHFDVDPGFEYLVRFHFCDIVSNNTQSSILKVYINSLSVSDNLDLRSLTSNNLGAPYYMDVVIRATDSEKLNVSVGPSRADIVYPIVFLNGLEIMKISNPKSSLDVLDSSSKAGSKMKVAVIAGLAVGLFSAIVLAAVLFLLCRRRRRLAHAIHSNTEDGVVNETESKITDSTAMFSVSKIGYRFPFVAIREATDNFSENLVIGVGGFGKVYKGVLRDNTKVAVKRGAPQSRQGLAEFRTEIEMLSQFRHRHLVSLIGYCDEQNEMIIIYEYMRNGSLKDYLYGSDFPSLSWRQRLGICVGAAKGLHYLHTGSTKAIIHRDVKTANILLDENLMAKVADFGLSKTGPEIDQTHVSTVVKGSFGYLDPQYLTRQQLTEKSDVYSFGVVMFEVLCGRPVIDPSLPREKVNLVEWAMKLHNKGQLEEIVDPCLAGQVKPESLRKFGEIIAKCLAEHGVDRPTVGDVLWNLESVLQLEGSEGSNGRLSSQADHVNPLETSVSVAEFSMGSAGDLAGFSMSKVFAQMVKEDMR